MLKVGITGGKGGTGKSTVAINAAYTLAKDHKVLLVDCDADCPGDHLLLSLNLDNQETVYSMFPIFDADKCTSCGECVDACMENAIVAIPNRPNYLVEDLCSGCNACKIVCPEDAITDGSKDIGFSYNTQFNKNGVSFHVVGGFANEGFKETSKIVNAVASRAEGVASDIGAEFVLYDTAAGIHCNVIAAMKRVDYIFGVTEPTPAGAHDLKNILELSNIMGFDSRIIINRSDIGDKSGVEALCGQYNTKIIEEIPHSRAVMESYAKGFPFAADNSLAETQSIARVCDYIKNLGGGHP